MFKLKSELNVYLTKNLKIEPHAKTMIDSINEYLENSIKLDQIDILLINFVFWSYYLPIHLLILLLCSLSQKK